MMQKAYMAARGKGQNDMDILTFYLNDADVKNDLHVSGSWEMCSGDVGENWKYQ